MSGSPRPRTNLSTPPSGSYRQTPVSAVLSPLVFGVVLVVRTMLLFNQLIYDCVVFLFAIFLIWVAILNYTIAPLPKFQFFARYPLCNIAMTIFYFIINICTYRAPFPLSQIACQILVPLEYVLYSLLRISSLVNLVQLLPYKLSWLITGVLRDSLPSYPRSRH
jgi:hypothetical protein